MNIYRSSKKEVLSKANKLKKNQKGQIMKKILKTLTIAVAATAILAECNGVNKEKLAELTAGKNFKQIEVAYVKASLNKKADDVEIYEHWLTKNGKKSDPTFDFELYKMKVQKDVQKQLKKWNTQKEKINEAVEKELAKIKSGKKLDWNIIRALKNESNALVFMPYDIKPINEYRKFIQQKKDELLETDKEREKKENIERKQREKEQLEKLRKELK